MHKPSIFILDRFSEDEKYVIRLNIPGIDRGHAVSLETETDLSYNEVKKLLDSIVDSLKGEIVIGD